MRFPENCMAMTFINVYCFLIFCSALFNPTTSSCFNAGPACFKRFSIRIPAIILCKFLFCDVLFATSPRAALAFSIIAFTSSALLGFDNNSPNVSRRE